MARTQDTRDTGMPTRAIHEAYLALQEQHREFRQVKSGGGDTRAARGRFQDAILTFYELVRPHLKHESALSGYWEGELPDYTGWDFNSAEAVAQHVRDRGTGVYQTQIHQDVTTVEQQALTDGGRPQGRSAWHELLELNWDTERLISVHPVEPDDDASADGGAATDYHIRVVKASVLPLRDLDHWRVREVQARETGDGFMAGEVTKQRRHEFEPGQKLVAAKRLLSEAADRLGALSAFEASTQRTEITREDLEKVEQWRQKQLDQ